MNSLTNRKRYTAEFKAQAVALVRMGKAVPAVAEDLCIGTRVLYRWLGRGDHSNVVGLDLPRPSSDLPADAELRQLRKENANLKLENDILKKAAVILGSKPLPPSAH